MQQRGRQGVDPFPSSGGAVTRKQASVVIAMALAMMASLVTEAEQTVKIPRIGILRPGSPPDPNIEAFRQGLAESNYTEGQNVSIEIGWAEGRNERFPSLAADLVRHKVDVIVAGGGGPVE